MKIGKSAKILKLHILITIIVFSITVTLTEQVSWAENSKKPLVNNQEAPWESNEKFQEALSTAGTHIRIAIFSATLKDPLPGELYNVKHAADMLSGTVVQQGEIFSQNKHLGPYTLAKGYQKGPTYSGNRVITTVGGGVCKIASVLYNLARLSNLQVIERYNHSLTVPYVPPGQDATVYYGSRDFKFRNNTGGPILIWAEMYGNTLKMAFYGRQLTPEVKWHHTVLKRLKTWIIYQFNPKLEPGTQKVVMPGQEGIVVKSWISIKYLDGTTAIRELGKSYYSPSPRIIERGPKR